VSRSSRIGAACSSCSDAHRGVRVVRRRRLDDPRQRALRVGVPRPQPLGVEHPEPPSLPIRTAFAGDTDGVGRVVTRGIENG
jgi:hypothetical protein